MSTTQNHNAISGKPRAIGDRILVTDMNFGEQVTSSGIILTSDNGKTRGVHPRWGKVYSKGPENKDPYSIGDWVLIEHGRWTRGIKMYDGVDEIEVRMIDTECVLAWSDEEPEGLLIGQE